MNITIQNRARCNISECFGATTISCIPFFSQRSAIRAVAGTPVVAVAFFSNAYIFRASASRFMAAMTFRKRFRFVSCNHQVIGEWKPRLVEPCSCLFVRFKELIHLEHAYQTLMAFRYQILSFYSYVCDNIVRSEAWCEHLATAETRDNRSIVLEVRLSPNRTVNKGWYAKLFTCINTRRRFYKRVKRVDIQAGHGGILCQYESPLGYFSESGGVTLLCDLSCDARVKGGFGCLARGACPQSLFLHRFDHVLGTHAFIGRTGEHLNSRLHRAELWSFVGSSDWRVVGSCRVLGGLAGVCRFARRNARRGLCGVRAWDCVRFLRFGSTLGHFACSFHSPRRAGNTDHEGVRCARLQGESARILKLFGGHHVRCA